MKRNLFKFLIAIALVLTAVTLFSCSNEHEHTLTKNEAINSGNGRYYHPDCYHMVQTIAEIRDLFFKNINPLMTAKQFSELASVINDIVFNKNVDVDYLKFAVEYYIAKKPGGLKHPPGLHYIIQDKDVKQAWGKYREKKILQKMKDSSFGVTKEELEQNIEVGGDFSYKPQNARSFADILG